MRLVDRLKFYNEAMIYKFSLTDDVCFLNIEPFYKRKDFLLDFGRFSKEGIIESLYDNLYNGRNKNVTIKSCEDLKIVSKSDSYTIVGYGINISNRKGNKSLRTYLLVRSDSISSIVDNTDSISYTLNRGTIHYFASEDQIILSDDYLDYRLKEFVNPKKEEKTYEPFILPSFMKCGYFINNFIISHSSLSFSAYCICIILSIYFFNKIITIVLTR